MMPHVKRHTTRWLLPAALVLYLFAPSVSAQVSEPAPPAPAAPAPEPAPAPDPRPIEVTVAGTSLARTAGSAHLVRRRELERFESDDPHTVLAAVPGVYSRGEDGVGLRPNIGIRGVNPDRSKKVTLMEDGVLFGPAPYSASAAYYFPLITRMVGVRVIKGPAAVSYGPSTVGGAIDFITRSIPSAPAGELDLAIGQYGYQKLHGHAGSSNGQTGFLIEAAHVSSTGFKELPGDADTGFYRNEVMVKGSHAFDPSSAWSNELRLKLSYSEELSNETYLGLSDADFRENPLRRYAASALDLMRNHRTSLVLTHAIEPLPDLSITTNVYGHHFYRVWRKANHLRGAGLFETVTDADSPRAQIFRAVLAGEADSATPQEAIFIGPNEREFVSHGIESRASLRAATGPVAHRIEYGLRFHHDRIDRRHSEDAFIVAGGELFPEGSPSVVTALNDASSLAFATHVIDAATLGDLTITPGVRFEAVRSSFDDRLETHTQDNLAQALIPGIGAFYAVTDQLGVLGGVYRGFNPPAPGAAGEPEPELSVNFEYGARFATRRARAEVVGFYNDYSNLTDICTFSSGCSDADVDRQFDAGRARIYGLEAMLDYAPRIETFELPIAVAYTLTQAEFMNSFVSEDPIFGEVETKDELPYVPRHQLTLTAGLEHPLAGGAASFRHVSRMREEPGQGPLSTALATDAQNVVDLSLYVRPLAWLRIYANGQNIGNDLAIVSRRPYGARPNAPRWLQVGVKASF
jgi:Fe(3+) dicitrate transport protein